MLSGSILNSLVLENTSNQLKGAINEIIIL